MEVKKLRITNRKQIELLVGKMEENPPIAKGLKFCETTQISKKSYTEIWKSISNDLNSIGPPMRTITEWQKVWSDYRQNVKKKLTHNKNESQATGGGQNRMKTLSSCEDAVVKLLSLDKAVYHSGSVFGLQSEIPSEAPLTSNSSSVLSSHREVPSGTPQPIVLPAPESPTPDLNNNEDFENIENINKNTSIGSSQPINKIRKRKVDEEDIRIILLKKQTEFMEQVAEDSKETARFTRKIFKLKEEHYRKKQKHMLEKEKNKQEELQYKMQLLEYKKQKLNILERNALMNTPVIDFD